MSPAPFLYLSRTFLKVRDSNMDIKKMRGEQQKGAG